jgi:hypothetical protein
MMKRPAAWQFSSMGTQATPATSLHPAHCKLASKLYSSKITTTTTVHDAWMTC